MKIIGVVKDKRGRIVKYKALDKGVISYLGRPNAEYLVKTKIIDNAVMRGDYIRLRDGILPVEYEYTTAEFDLSNFKTTHRYFKIMYKNLEVLDYELIVSTDKIISIVITKQYNISLLPFSNVTSLVVSAWLSSRPISYNREFLKQILVSIGVGDGNLHAILELSHGLSLTDNYWVKPLKSDIKWSKINLYDNGFSDGLATVTFWGSPANLRGALRSPEYVGDGMLPKMWKREDGIDFMYKRGSRGYANSGFEPYAEVIASNILSYLDIPYAPQKLAKINGEVCNKSSNFVNRGYDFVPSFTTSNFEKQSIDSYLKVYGTPFRDMIVFDAIICNCDRHLNNFGLIFKDGKPVAFAPLYDHGMSLLYETIPKYDYPLDLNTYTRFDSFNDDSLDTALYVATTRHLGMVSKISKCIDKCVIGTDRDSEIIRLVKHRCSEFIRRFNKTK